MKKLSKLARNADAFFKLFKPNLLKKRNVISDDLRKIGIYALGLGFVALIVSGDKITDMESITIGVVGLILWVIGLLFREPGADEK